MMNLKYDIKIECKVCRNKTDLSLKTDNFVQSFTMKSLGKETEYFYRKDLVCLKCNNEMQIGIMVFEYPYNWINFTEVFGGGFNRDLVLKNIQEINKKMENKIEQKMENKFGRTEENWYLPELKQDTVVEFDIDGVFKGTGRVVGIASTGIPVAGRSYIIQPNIFTPTGRISEEYPYTHFVCFEIFLKVLSESDNN